MVSCGDGDDKSKTKPTKNSLAVDLSDTSNHASGSHFYSQSFSGNYYFKLLSFYDYEFYLTILDIFSSNNSRATYKTDIFSMAVVNLLECGSISYSYLFFT